jgi:hypothetical protein
MLASDVVRLADGGDGVELRLGAGECRLRG